MTENHPRQLRGRYMNHHAPNVHKRTKDFFLWMIGYFKDGEFEKAPENFSYPLPTQEFNAKKPWAMWIGHSTFLICLENKHILTDPIWSTRCSPVPFIGPKRKHAPPIPLEKLPKIDYVLISHDHYDHLDRMTVERLHMLFPEILWIVPTGVKKWFNKLEIIRVVELNWWENRNIDSTFKITSVPAQHFSGRRAPNLNKTLWAGYVLEDLHSTKTFYFAGDTGYNPHDFKKIGDHFPSIDLSFIPIGAYSPRQFMAPVHTDPKNAVNIHIDVNSKLSLGMHWKTFRLSDEPMDQPPFELLAALKAENIDPSSFLAIDPGMKVNW